MLTGRAQSKSVLLLPAVLNLSLLCWHILSEGAEKKEHKIPKLSTGCEVTALWPERLLASLVELRVGTDNCNRWRLTEDQSAEHFCWFPVHKFFSPADDSRTLMLSIFVCLSFSPKASFHPTCLAAIEVEGYQCMWTFFTLTTPFLALSEKWTFLPNINGFTEIITPLRRNKMNTRFHWLSTSDKKWLSTRKSGNCNVSYPWNSWSKSVADNQPSVAFEQL